MEDIEKMTKNYAEYMTLSALPEAVVRQCSRFDTGATLLKKGHEYLQSGEEEKAVECYRGAAEKGEKDAYLALSLCYECGIGMVPDSEQADDMFEKAAELWVQSICEAMGAEIYINSEEETFDQVFEAEDEKRVNHEAGNFSQSSPKNEKICIMSPEFKKILSLPSGLNRKYEISEIKHIVFADKINKQAFSGYYKDISASGDGSVIGWIEDTTLHIEADGKVTAPVDCTDLFKDMNIENIVFNDAFDTGQTTSMHSMFYGCKNLKKLDLRELNTGQVKYMRTMFAFCRNLEELNLCGFDTRQVTDMRAMFYGCKNLKKLNLNECDLGQVRDMRTMFAFCNKLEKLDLREFDISKVRDKKDMFFGCDSLPEQFKKVYGA